MSEPSEIDPGSTRRSGDVPKTRLCLCCRTSFESEWSGERICRRCKGTSGWRSGLPSHNGSG